MRPVDRRTRRSCRAAGALLATLVVLAGGLASCSGDGSKGSVTGAWVERNGSTSTTVPPAAPSTVPAVSEIRWRDCGDNQCGTLTVPLDGVDPDAPAAAPASDAPTIDLALVRVPARDPDRRIGSLLVNPGGPGASGIDLAEAASRFLPGGVLDRFDVIGWDPRGVGASSPIDCGEHLDPLFSGDTSPDDAAEWTALDDVSRQFAQACLARSGADLLAHVSTLETVHDMERIRLALGEDEINFLGFSYGTELGALYATLHPDHVRTMVLDGAVDTSLSALEAATQQAEGLEQGLEQFAQACAADRSCAIHDDPLGTYTDVVQAIERAPLRVRTGDGERLVTPAVADIAVAAALYSQSAWSDLQQALADARDGDGRGLLDLFDQYMDRDLDGAYSNEWSAFLAISCVDGPSLGGPDAYPAAEAQAARRAPRFGAANVGLGLPCAYWPVPTGTPLPAVSAPTAPPIVVIGTRHDPITPVAWAESLTRELGGQAHLVVFEGQGHTSFGSGNGCLDSHIEAYLVDLDVPPADLSCG